MKIGASLTINFKVKSISEFLKKVAEKGLVMVELTAEPPHCFIGDLDQRTRRRIRAEANDLGLDLTVHSTFSDLNPAALNDNVRRFAVEEIKKCINFTADLEASLLTVHPGDLGATGMEFPEKIRELNIESFGELADFAESFGQVIGLENMPICPWQQLEDSFSPKGIQTIVEEINSKSLKITWDIGHSNTTKYPMEEFVECYANYLHHIHIHDNHGPGPGWRDTHLEVGKGTVSWSKFFEAIKNSSYKGGLILELSDWEEITRSLQFLAQFNLTD